MDDHHTALAADIGQAADVLNDVLLAGMLRGSRGRKGTPVHHHVILHVLDDESAARWIEGEIGPFAGALRPRASCRPPTARRDFRMHERLDAWADFGAHRIE